MAQVHKFSDAEISEIMEARRKNTDERVDARLMALELRARGASRAAAAIAAGFETAYVTQLVIKYKRKGITAFVGDFEGQ